jgi:hypothetical protein
MPTYFARATGNVNAAIWATTPSGTAGNLFPSFAVGDTLMANGFTVTLNVSLNLGATGQVRNDTTDGATAGGTFLFASNVTLTANATGGTTGTPAMRCNGAFNASIVGNITGGSGGAGIDMDGSITNSFTITGTVRAVGGGAGATISGGLLTIIGEVVGGAGTGAGLVAFTAGNVVITGNVTAGTGSASHGFRQQGNGSLVITGNVIGSPTGTGNAINLFAGGGAITITGSVIGGTNVAAISGSAGPTNAISIVRAVGGAAVNAAAGVAAPVGCAVTVRELEFGDFGSPPVSTPVRFENSVNNVVLVYRLGMAKKTLIDSDSLPGRVPLTQDVRLGVSYDAGNKTGTCAVPPASSVLFGVPVDNTVGTAAVSSSAVQAACEAALAAFSGGRLANVATVASVGQQLADVNN